MSTRIVIANVQVNTVVVRNGAELIFVTKGDSGSTCGGLSKIRAFYQNPQYIGLDQSAIYMGCLGHNSLSIPPTLVRQSTFNVSRSDMTRARCLDSCKEKGQTGWAAVQGNQ